MNALTTPAKEQSSEEEQALVRRRSSLQSVSIRATSFSRSGTTRHHVQRPRFSPTINPAAAKILVWCETVGWLLLSGPSRAQLQTSSSDAISDSIRSRAGSLNAEKICARSYASASESAVPDNGLQQLTTSSSIVIDFRCVITQF